MSPTKTKEQCPRCGQELPAVQVPIGATITKLDQCRSNGLRPLDRMEYLAARLGYIAQLQAEGESVEGIMQAVCLIDRGQVELLLMTIENIASGSWFVDEGGLVRPRRELEDGGAE